MNIPFSVYPPAITLFGALFLLLAIGSALALARGKRLYFWAAFACCILSALSSAGLFIRLESLHGDLVNGSPGIKTKSDILARYGTPSRIDSYQKESKTVECWIYEVTMFQPRIMKQFEMIDDVVWATIQRN